MVIILFETARETQPLNRVKQRRVSTFIFTFMILASIYGELAIGG